MNHLFIFLIMLSLSGGAYASSIDEALNQINNFLATVLFIDVWPGEHSLPFLVTWLIVGSVFLTFRMGFINLRMLPHALDILRGRVKQSPNKIGETTPFQALTTALSATVGLGNISGVALAIGAGGVGAIFWMMLAAFFGMTAKFTEVTLGQMYRETRKDGKIMGGGMMYISKGFAEKGWPKTGRVLAITFAIFALGGALGAGCMYQVDQASAIIEWQLPQYAKEIPLIFSITMAALVGLVILGGIRRIAEVSSKLVPAMVSIYVLAALWVILSNISALPDAVALIFHEAFTLEAGLGGLFGAIVAGVTRAVFSSEAGIGSAPMAHATAKVAHPARQGLVALYEPFIDTLIICTMTGLVIAITGVYNMPEYAHLIEANKGSVLTGIAFGQAISWFPIALALSVVLFAYSTMLAWSYYGERNFAYLVGDKYSFLFRYLFITMILITAFANTTTIVDLSTFLFLCMALPNFIALYFLSSKVRSVLDDYQVKRKAGEL